MASGKNSRPGACGGHFGPHLARKGSLLSAERPSSGQVVSCVKSRPRNILRSDASWGMAEDHQFTIRLEPDRVRIGRFYWALFKGKQVYNRSQLSFATKREAAAEGEKVLDMRIAAWMARI